MHLCMHLFIIAFIHFYFLIFIYVFLDLLQGVGKDAVGVLKMIRMRLQAEMKTIGRDDLKLLAKLLQENDLEVRRKDCSGHFYRICCSGHFQLLGN